MSGRNLDKIALEAVGALAAQSVVSRVRDQWATPAVAWLACAELVAMHGWKSAAVRSFVTELAKRAASATEAPT